MSALLRFLRIAVVVAAGAGAWFGYDAYVEARDETDMSDSIDGTEAVPAPWADLGLVVADAVWDGPMRSSLQPPDEVVRQATVFDPSSGRARMTLFDPQGEEVALVETDDNEIFVKQGDAGWVVPTDQDLGGPATLRGATYTPEPPTLLDLVPEVVWPHTKIMSDVAGGDASDPTRVLTIRMKGGAFVAADPALAAQWRANAYLPHVQGRVEIEVELDTSGHVVRLRYLTVDDSVYEFGPVDTVPIFEAPFVD